MTERSERHEGGPPKEGNAAGSSEVMGAARASTPNNRQPRVVGDGQGRPGPDGKPAKPPLWSNILWVIIWVVMAGVVIALVSTSSNTPKPVSLSYSTFLSDVTVNQVKNVQIDQASGVISGALKDGKQFTAQGPTGGLPGTDLTLLQRHHVARNYAAPSSTLLPSLLIWVLPIGLIVLLWLWLSRRSGRQMSAFTGWSRSQAKVHVTEHPSTTFGDIAGYDAVKQEVGEVVNFLKEPDRFRDIGARIPKGILLVGPPGTGKTLFARAVAGEARVAFITITGSQFMEMFVGVGAARVRDLFKTAREHKPSIVFVDEIDAIGRKRGTGLGGTHDEREQTLNQLLAEMDGFEPDEGVVVLAATNRPDVLDPALLRAGRFDRQITVPLPSQNERREILRVHTRDKRMDQGVDLEALARGTPGMSGADLENMMNEAALIAVRRESATIEQGDIDAARDRVLMGMQRTSLALSAEERRIVSFHEAGHAVLAQVLEHADPVHKVTILPTGMALGSTQQVPEEERQLYQRPEIEDALAVRLGGRTAEELVFGTPSTGAEDDLTSATELAGRMVKEWGMSDAVGHRAWGPHGPVFLGEDLIHTREYSEETATEIDHEVGRILDAQAARALATLRAHRPALDAVAKALHAKETLEGQEVARLVAEAQPVAPRPPRDGQGSDEGPDRFGSPDGPGESPVVTSETDGDSTADTHSATGALRRAAARARAERPHRRSVPRSPRPGAGNR